MCCCVLGACKKFLQIDPPVSTVVSEAVYKSDETVISAMNGIYHQVKSSAFAGGSYESIGVLAGYTSDELVNYYQNSAYDEFYKNALTPINAVNQVLWSSLYKTIYSCNAMLEGLANSDGVSVHVKRQLEGEAKFIRAFAHFYLVNLYDDVPLVLTTDYRINQIAGRTTANKVYEQIIADLLSAQSILSEDYPSSERVRVNKAAASGMLARVYLYRGFWDKAVTQANYVLNDNRYSLEPDLKKIFLNNSREAIWQLLNPGGLPSTREGEFLILTGAPTISNPASLNINLVNAFEAADKRNTDWVGIVTSGSNTYYYPYKYKLRTNVGATTKEYSMVLRLAEIYLIRAEARAKQNQLAAAIADVDAIRNRAGLPLIALTSPNISQADLLLAIERERRFELFTEWGHRWLDLKRVNRATVLLNSKPNWNATDVLFPIPENEMRNNPNLKPQNPGY
jgi:hypothetical protein